MRPTITSKHRELSEKTKRDMEAYEQAGGKVRRATTTEHRGTEQWDDTIRRESETAKGIQR